MMPASDAIPAATVIILREAEAGGPPELLMLERARAMAFAAGALVFPGGRIDPADRALAATLTSEDEELAAAKIAAIRETIEEAGIAIGLHPLPAPPVLAAVRAALHAGQSLGRVLSDHDLSLDLAQLEPFARWRPDHPGMRIYDTRFFLARLPAGAAEATVDGTENTRLFWATARAVLDEAAAGRASLIYPTRRNLERLALFADHGAAVADARAHPVETITPFEASRDGVPHLCIPAGLGYPITEEPIAASRRA